MKSGDFEYLSALLKKHSGLALTAEKTYLLESRLLPVSKKHNLSDLSALVGRLRKTSNKDLISEVVEAMTTNESFFFRDTRPFDTLRDVILPPLLEERKMKRRIRIWCAAASSGQEPYSIAIILNELARKLNGWKIEIVGTDISNDILDKAKSGRYSQFEVQRGMPVTLLMKYFTQSDDAWEIQSGIREMVSFKYWNLLDDLSPLGKFDIVFCRNVLIYFDAETKTKVLNNISGLMPKDGMLFLGGAENVLGVTKNFEPVKDQRGVYAVA